MRDEMSPGRLDAAAPALAVAGAVLAAVGFVLSFTVAPLVLGADVTPELVGDQLVRNQLLFSQKIFYFHVPVAIVSFAALAACALFSGLYLKTRKTGFDLRARVAAEVALVFILATMGTGIPWTRFEWGVWWTWEPRLTTYLILLLLCIGYFVLRAALDEGERRATLASVFGIIMFIDAPICFLITRLVPSSLHPVIFRSDSGLSVDMLVPFLICIVGIGLFALALYLIRRRQQEVAVRIEALKIALEELEDKRLASPLVSSLATGATDCFGGD